MRRLAGAVWLAGVLGLSLGVAGQLQVARQIFVNGQVGQVAGQPADSAKGGPVNLPYISSDGAGGLWYVYNDGALRQQMNPAIFAQGGMLTIDGAGFNVPNNQGTLLAKTGELVLQNPQMNGMFVSRHILFEKDAGYVRYVDVLRNSTDQDRTVTVGLQTVLNWGVQQGQTVNDAKHKDQPVAWLGTTNMARTVLEIYGGGGAKVLPNIIYQNGGNVIQANYSVVVPAGKEIALMHVHMFVPSADAGVKTISDLTVARLTHGLGPQERREIVNFAPGQTWLLDLEILRGDVFDVVELRGGDQYKGTLRETSFKLDTFHGPVELPTSQVIALLNIGLLHPRQLLVTLDGQIFGGHLAKPTIDLALTSGQVISIPVDQISRLGYRNRPDEPAEFTFDKPLVLMRGGDRIAVQLPAQKIQVASRFGQVDLDPAAVASIAFQTEESGVHDIYLTDGSHFSGLVCGDSLEMKLAGIGGGGAGADQTVQFPAAELLRLQFTATTPEPDTDGPVLSLTNGDVLCGTLQGTPRLRTAFDTITLEGGQIHHITRGGGREGDVQVTLWDGSSMSGQLEEPTLVCRLLSGTELKVPVPLLNEYNQPHPMPSAEMIQQIQSAAADLGADDWRQRDRAQATLESMGPAVIGVLRQAHGKLPPEAQQRIDAIIKKLEAHPAKPAPAATPNDINLRMQGN